MARAQEIERLLNIMGWPEYIRLDKVSAWEEETGARFILDGYSSNAKCCQSCSCRAAKVVLTLG